MEPPIRADARLVRNQINAGTVPMILVTGISGGLGGLVLQGLSAIDGLEGDGSPLMTALAFRYPKAAEALARKNKPDMNSSASGWLVLTRKMTHSGNGLLCR